MVRLTSTTAIPVVDPTILESVPTPLPVPTYFADENAQSSPYSSDQTTANGDELLVPVAGVKRESLIDTFTDARSNGRTHDAIDIMAAAGTPVIAAADGRIVKFWDSEAGGITIYEITSDQKYFLYYAHLQRRADDIKEGDTVKRGTIIGYVGDTGNAGAGVYHLHFSIANATDPKRYWTGTYINPYSLLSTPSKLP